MNRKRGDLLEIIIITKENIPSISKQTGRSEQELRDALSHAKAMGQTCVIAHRFWD